jgi:hypothetical protein
MNSSSVQSLCSLCSKEKVKEGFKENRDKRNVCAIGK